MPINIPDELPAKRALEKENIFTMTRSRAARQDIRPLEIVIMNLMPDKITTETQILRLIGNSPLQINLRLLHTKTHQSTHTPEDHLVSFYEHFDDIKGEKFDGLIITGAPVEMMEFEQVNYWKELQLLMDWSLTNVFSTFHICWAAQAGLYHHYGIRKYPLDDKMFGVFQHTVNNRNAKILRGFDNTFYVPHSRHTEIRREDIEKVPDLEILSESKDSGVYLVGRRDGKQFFVTGHSEYDPETLRTEYERDVGKGPPDKCAAKLLPERQSGQQPCGYLARPLQPALLQLAELLRLPGNPLRDNQNIKRSQLTHIFGICWPLSLIHYIIGA